MNGPYGSAVLDSFATLNPAWVKLAGTGTLTVSGGVFVPPSGDYVDAYRNDIGPFDSSQLRVEAFGQVDVMPGSDYFPSVGVQMSTSNHYFYSVYVRDATRIRISKRSAGGSVDLATITHSLAAGDWIGIAVHPAGLVEAFTSTDGVNWTKRGEATDTEMRSTTARLALSAGVGDGLREWGGGQQTAPAEPVWVALGAKTGINYVGGWVAGTPYNSGDVVIHNGVQYMAVKASTGSTPPPLSPQALTVIKRGTVFPVAPFDGEEFVLVDSLAAPGFQWRFRYAAGRTTNKWEFVGGSPLRMETAAVESTGSTTYANLSGGATGPAITIPAAGIYIVTLEGRIRATATGGFGAMSYDIGGTAAVDADAIIMYYNGGNSEASLAASRRKTLAAATLLFCKYRITVGGGALTAGDRAISVLPVAVSG